MALGDNTLSGEDKTQTTFFILTKPAGIRVVHVFYKKQSHRSLVVPLIGFTGRIELCDQYSLFYGLNYL